MNAKTAAATAAQPPALERQSVIAWAGGHFGVEASKVMGILRATCFKGDKDGEASDAEVAALLIVARSYNLNPFLREIFAFRDQRGGIVPIVGVDGWSRIINDKEELDGIEFAYSPAGEPEWVECTIHRKDRHKPTVVREFLEECQRDTKPWKSHKRRMLRHKALIQCARIAFGFAGIYDEDEGERIIEKDITPAAQPAGAVDRLRAAVGKPKPEEPGNPAETVGTLEERDGFVAAFAKCTDPEPLSLKLDEARFMKWSEADQAVIQRAYDARLAELKAGSA